MALSGSIISGKVMTLNERIATARKQSGLSQEQLGEKLGVSRQAVSKWENGQANPDVAYLAEMCRLFGVSSDWLLLGVEDSTATKPQLCPSCQHVVTGLDNFCPSCGYSLHPNSSPATYTLVFNPTEGQLFGGTDLHSLSISKRITFSPDSPLSHPLTDDEAAELAHSAPLVLDHGLSKEQVQTILDIVMEEDSYFICTETDRSAADLPPQQCLRPAEALRPHREPMSFGGMVCAVVVGLFAFLIIGSFL